MQLDKRYEVRRLRQPCTQYMPLGQTDYLTSAVAVAKNRPYIQIFDKKTKVIINKNQYV